MCTNLFFYLQRVISAEMQFICGRESNRKIKIRQLRLFFYGAFICKQIIIKNVLAAIKGIVNIVVFVVVLIKVNK